MSKGASDFKKIPYVGEATEADLLALGYEGIASLKGADPDEMFERTKALGRGNDRCILYVYRMVCYYASTPRPDRAKLKWWLWKDQIYEFDPREPFEFERIC
ncbi:helix-hairpin-helix domain-containing protein [uncultured Campylobacter sp.]|uniref:helix-hairpin-helix domain-containing protein n=1 Tax=uncultured Campylobacter sp. TaxID=218934 RepID=UPI00260C9C50|nr:helix-hairpin-helix domain-containing protein [uncultured Campylobacter sp.]